MKDALGHGSNPRGVQAAHQQGVQSVGKYHVSNDVRDAHSGELYGNINAVHDLTGQKVGVLNYGAFWNNGRREVGIKMIEVDPAHQHQGLATQMLDKLSSEFTEHGRYPKVKWGMMTPEGSALKKAYYSRRQK